MICAILNQISIEEVKSNIERTDVVDNLTHGMFGIGIFAAYTSVTGVHINTPLGSAAFVAAMIGSEIPDIDIIFRLFGDPILYLQHHRGISHSILFCILWTILIASGLTFWYNGNFFTYILLSFIGIVVHVGLDALTAYGTQVFWPFYRKRIALDVLFVYDYVFVTVGFIGFTLFGLGFSIQKIVWFCWSFCGIYIFLKGICVLVMKKRIRSQCKRVLKISLPPTCIPWIWQVVIDLKSGYEMGKISPWGMFQKQLYVNKPEKSKQITYALEYTRLGQVMNWFSRHLYWCEEKHGEEIHIRLADALFRSKNSFPFSGQMALKYDVNQQLSVIYEQLRGQVVQYTPAENGSTMLGEINWMNKHKIHIPISKRKKS